MPASSPDLHNKHLDVSGKWAPPPRRILRLAAHKCSHLYGRYVCFVCGQLLSISVSAFVTVLLLPYLVAGRAWLHKDTHIHVHVQSVLPTCTLPMTVVNMTVIRTLIQMLRMFVLARTRNAVCRKEQRLIKTADKWVQHVEAAEP